MRALVPFLGASKALDSFFDDWPSLDRITFYPAMDVTEDDEGYLVEMDLPGMTAENVDISISNGILVVKGERKIERKKSHRTERGHGLFSRSISLPDCIDVESISASFKDGALSIVMPKGKQAKPYKVQIKTSG